MRGFGGRGKEKETQSCALKPPSNSPQTPSTSLPFQKVVDFQWHPSRALPWTMLSVSDDAEDEQIGGGSLQIWRINHLIYDDEDKVVAELDKYT